MARPNGVIPRVPTIDIGLNIFLAEIANDITDEELKTLKFMCLGTHDGISKRDREKIGDAIDLFTKLRELQVITRENLLTLQAMIWHIGRKDLYERFVKYCESGDRTLYFFADPHISDENQSLYRFHVKGYTTNGDLDYLNKLRDTVANILCCPAEKILVRGITESNSIFIYFAIPKMCDGVLQTLSKKKWDQLESLGVDEIVRVDHIEKQEEREKLQAVLRDNISPCPDRATGSKNAESVNIPSFARQDSNRNAILLSGDSHPGLDSVLSIVEKFERKIEIGAESERYAKQITTKPSFRSTEKAEATRKKQPYNPNTPSDFLRRPSQEISESKDRVKREGDYRRKPGLTDSGFED